ncbi:MAG: HAD-IC family P-type ATPase [Oscillospiraceae bacterium]|nr:HAD-IC family P-type ATPase [Oscillospiraceae bacterium]
MNNKGLTSAEASLREKEGKINGDFNISTKSVGEIFRSNTLTFFNILNIFLAFCVFLTGEYKNMLFLGVVVSNVCIGVFQELRAKRVTDRFSLMVRDKVRVKRDSETISLPTSQIVLDDVIFLGEGEQIPADCEVINGEVEADESLVTGESEPVVKKAGDFLLAGGFIICGEAEAAVRKVGEDSFAFSIMKGAKYLKKPVSEMFRSIDKIVKWLAVLIIPVGLTLLAKSVFFTDEDFPDAVNSTVAAVIGMIPQGLILLTSAVMAVSVIRLSRHKALVRDMYCTETLARVDVLCLDKTGTLTTGEMSIEALIPLGGDFKEAEDALCALMHSVPDKNPTATAIRKIYNAVPEWETLKAVSFSSARKWSGASFKEKGSFILGAAEFVLDKIPERLAVQLKNPAFKGKRLLVLAKSPVCIEDNRLPASLSAAALLVVGNRIRPEARQTLEFFDKQGVEIKIISGDNPLTIKSTAVSAGVKNAEMFIDMSGIDEKNETELEKIAEKYIIFGRATPQQKLALIKALKKNHVVGMVGDGVNDVLSLKEADCSVAMQSGSEAARNVSSLVLLDNNFAALPKAVAEGRRAINNLERSAALFLTKTVYSLILVIIFLFIIPPYPFLPIQLTLINSVFIGIPSFILALEKNDAPISGSFIPNVLVKAVPFGFCSVFGILLLTVFGETYALSHEQVRTIATLVLGINSFAVLCRICRPVDKKRLAVIAASGILFSTGVDFLGGLLSFTVFTPLMHTLTFFLCAAAIPSIIIFPKLAQIVASKLKIKGIRKV